MSDSAATPPIDNEHLAILRCPVAVHYTDRGDDPGRLELIQRSNGDWWLVCPDSGCKYPIREGIPIMLIDIGMQYRDTPLDQLPPIAETFTD